MVYDALAIVGERSGQPPVEVLEQAVKSLDAGARGAQPPRRRELPGPGRGPASPRADARRPLEVQFARDRREKGMPQKIAGEILDAINQQGNAYKRKDDMYRMAQANKAFAHYRW